MTKTLLVAGYGPGISNAVAERFGKEDFRVALVARNQARLDEGVKSLEAKGITAKAFAADLADPAAAAGVVGRVREAFGGIDAIAWVAYSGGAGDVLTVDAAELRASLDIATTSLVAAIKAALPDLKARKGSVLVTNGGYGLFVDELDAIGAMGAMGLSIANSAKHKLVGVLSHKLRDEGVHVGEVMVLGMVKGTAFDQGNANLDPKDIGEKFWESHRSRGPTFIQVG